jgi:hypothetical protein
MRRELILSIDGIVNLALGLGLILFPQGLPKTLGLPIPSTSFYASILGAVLVGIGLALLVERLWGPSHATGLGVEGAIAINLCGGGALMGWLVAGDLSIPIRGYLLLWAVAVIVLGIGLVELILRTRQELTETY